MEYGAIDLHTRKTLIRIVAEDGAVVLDRDDHDDPRGVRAGVWRARADAGVARNGHGE